MYELDEATGCWNWAGPTNRDGYGVKTYWHKVERRVTSTTAHRFVYEIERGPIPQGLTLDHLCSNPLCVNPDHLEPVTHSRNQRRGAGPRRRSEEVFKCGHPRANNTYVSSQGFDVCYICKNNPKQRKEKVGSK